MQSPTPHAHTHTHTKYRADIPIEAQLKLKYSANSCFNEEFFPTFFLIFEFIRRMQTQVKLIDDGGFTWNVLKTFDSCSELNAVKIWDNAKIIWKKKKKKILSREVNMKTFEWGYHYKILRKVFQIFRLQTLKSIESKNSSAIFVFCSEAEDSWNIKILFNSFTLPSGYLFRFEFKFRI